MTTGQLKKIALEGNYLEDYRSAIRSKTIPWEGFARSELLSTQDAKRLTELDGLPVDKKVEKIVSAEHLDDYTKTLIGLLVKELPIERADIKKFVLVLISDLLVSETFISKLSSIQKSQPDSILLPFINYINSSDEIIKLLALYNLTAILIQPTIRPTDASIVSSAFSALNSLIESTNFNLKFLALELITEFLAVKSYRSIYWEKHEKYIPALFTNLNGHLSQNNTVSVQFQYKILLCLWLLSFNDKALVDLSKSYLSEFLSLLQLVKVSVKEKIVRLVISIIINLTTIPTYTTLSTNNLKYFILTGNILPTLNNLKERKWTDEELIGDLDILQNNVQAVYSKLTSFDEYLQELNSRQFRNSPVHSSDEFFIDNLHHFQDNNYKVFKSLLSLMDEAMDPKSYAYLLSDVGKILKLDSKAIDVLTNENKKAKVMEFLNHKSSEVRYEALKATQFIVSQTFK